MTARNRITAVLTLAAVAMVFLVLPAAAARKIPAQLPDPDTKPPLTNKPVSLHRQSKSRLGLPAAGQQEVHDRRQDLRRIRRLPRLMARRHNAQTDQLVCR